jgi:hypothetical protein
MANIGSFKKSGQELQGEIVTLSLQTKGVRIVPETDQTSDTPRATGSTSVVLRSEPRGPSAPTRAAIISRSSSTIRASMRRSTRTSSTTKAPRPTP